MAQGVARMAKKMAQEWLKNEHIREWLNMNIFKNGSKRQCLKRQMTQKDNDSKANDSKRQ
jgi:hypothetical protein